MPTTVVESKAVVELHEIVDCCAQAELALNSTFTNMLNEHYSHHTERRGCGYTQAYRALADYINRPRDPLELDDLNIFADPPVKALRWLLSQAPSEGLKLSTWRNLDQQPQVLAYLQQQFSTHSEFRDILQEQVTWQQQLRHLPKQLKQEESQLWMRLVVDVVLPDPQPVETYTQLHLIDEKPKVGSCTLAEKFFLDIAHLSIPRKGLINIVINDAGLPILLEKVHVGDSHSCITLAPLWMNEVLLPVGSLLATSPPNEYDMRSTVRPCRELKGDIMTLSAYDGFWFLRLSTLAISPAHRQRAFGVHFAWQKDNGLFGHDDTQMSQLIDLAQQQI